MDNCQEFIKVEALTFDKDGKTESVAARAKNDDLYIVDEGGKGKKLLSLVVKRLK